MSDPNDILRVLAAKAGGSQALSALEQALSSAEGRRAVQRSARRAEPAEVTIHNDGTYTVRPNKGRGGRDQSRGTAPARTAGGRQPSPGARFAPNGTAPRKPKNDQQKENTAWKTSKKKK